MWMTEPHVVRTWCTILSKRHGRGPNSSADALRFNRSLEHMGQDTKTLPGHNEQIYGLGGAGAEVEINAPHPRHDNFLYEPRARKTITPKCCSCSMREPSNGSAQAPQTRRLGFI